MNQYTTANTQPSAYMQNAYANGGQNFMNMPPELQAMTSQPMAMQPQQLMTQQPQVRTLAFCILIKTFFYD